MNAILLGQLDLDRFFDDLTPIEGIGLTGASTASDETTVCATIGTPHFYDDEAEVISRRSGPAAGFLHIWHRYGENCAAQARGAFAVVIADTGKKSVFLAIDRFAIETLCYRLDGNQLLFSDRADCVTESSDDLDPQALFDFLYFHMIPAPRTIFRNVYRIPAAHALLVDVKGARQFRYWPAEFDEKHREPFDDAKTRFRQIIRESVAEAIAGEAEIATFLSGGTDSSTVAGTLCELTGEPAHAYSIGFAAEGYDEMEYARIAARHFGCDHHEYYVTPSDILSALPEIARHYDQPFGNSSALPAYYCAKMAKADGCTKMLAGDGGDELFGGNARYATQKFFDFYHRLPAGLRRTIEPFCGEDSPLRKIPGLRQATGYVRHSRIPMPDRMESFNLVMHLEPANVLTPSLLAQIDTGEPQAHMRATWEECHAGSLVNRMLAYDWRYTLADCDLPKVQGATSLAGIPAAYPLLADALVDFSLQLSPDWKVRGFRLRWFFKEALRDFLPEAIITKKKKGFGLPFGVWTARDPALKRLAAESLGNLAERGILREDFAKKLIADYLPEHPGYYGEMIWILTILEQWLQKQAPKFRL
ncbi:asparagine synthetase B family protein [Propionivibrio limicola]|uniref:asparagine synthetase B family protein n=1 Tax=Propionivibrio limicola TaxID=167645 RepID=UPI0012922EF7|nr:asparagine synthase-related protein [Propionivibrio limicola]